MRERLAAVGGELTISVAVWRPDTIGCDHSPAPGTRRTRGGDPMTTILMADDSALLREGLVGLLERQGYQIVGQEHRADALLSAIAGLATRVHCPTS